MRFPGGKGRLYPQLINLMPPHKVFIEAFAGGAAVLRHKLPAEASIAIDRDLRPLVRLTHLNLNKVMLICADALQFLRCYRFTEDEFLYCDPPYLPSTRRRERVYRHELDEQQHRELLDLLLEVPCPVLLSGYPSPLYNSTLRGWQSDVLRAKTHAGCVTERVWRNYPLPRVLHDSRFLGANFRERYNIRRKLKRHQIRLASLSSQEQAEIYRWLGQRLQQSEGC